MEFSYLPDPEQHPCWDGIVSILKPAADYGDIPVKEPEDDVWIVFEGQTIFAAVVTRQLDEHECEVRLIGGVRAREWLPYAEGVLCQWARDCGAWRLTARGRRGWGRLTRDLGWKPLGRDDAGRMLYERDLG